MAPFLRTLSHLILARTLRRTLPLGLGVLLAFAAQAEAQNWAPPDEGPDGVEAASHPSSGAHFYPARGVKRNLKVASNLMNHGGPVIPSAHVVFIFWGPSFNSTISPDHNYARTLESFRNQFGTNSYW